MMEARLIELGYITDGLREFTIALAAYPLMTITLLQAPSSARPGQTVTIHVEWANIGGSGGAWVGLGDLDNPAIMLYSRLFNVAAGQTGYDDIVLIMPNRNWRLKLQVGHEIL